MNNKIDLYDYGLSEETKTEFDENHQDAYLGRISVEYRNAYRIITENGDIMGRVSGSLSYHANYKSDYPAVGDWVVLDREEDEHGQAVIRAILTRRSMFSRNVAGKKEEEQALATNIDTVFICMAFGHDFNIPRLERYLGIAWYSGATPVIVLTKADLCDDVPVKLQEVAQTAAGIDLIVTSAITKEGMEDIQKHINPRKTIAFIGSSGVGKSTLINLLLGEERQKVSEVRKDEKGKHTTSYRELILLPSGGIVIDTPGMRELQIIHADLDTTFSDIEALATQCRFMDCSHMTEPDCAVKQAIEEGQLTEERLNSYRKLKNELEYLEDKAVLHPKQREKKKVVKMMGSLDGTKKITHR